MLASQTEIAEAREAVTALVNEAIKVWSLASANFVILGDGRIVKYGMKMCHYHIGYPGVAFPRLVSTEVARRRRQKQFPSEDVSLDPFIDFLMTDDLWAPWIVDSGEDYITIDASAPQTVLQALMMSSRCVWEASTESFELFNEAVAKGLPPRVAFLYAFHTNASTRDYSIGKIASSKIQGATIILPKSNHRPWGLLKKAGIQKYLEGSYPQSPSYNEKPSINGVSSMFGSVRTEYDEDTRWLLTDLFADPKFTQALASFRQSRAVEEGISVPNPFAPKTRPPASPGIGEVSFTEYRNVVLEYLINEYSIEEEVRNVA